MALDISSQHSILQIAYDSLSKQKAPKVLADAITWVNSALTEFGIGGLSLRALIDFLKTGLQNSNAAVRTNATKTLVTIKLFAGSSAHHHQPFIFSVSNSITCAGIKDLLEDVNSQLLSTISSEFDKAEGTPAPVPTRTSADLLNAAPSAAGGKAAASADPLDDLFPRVELDGLQLLGHDGGGYK